MSTEWKVVPGKTVRRNESTVTVSKSRRYRILKVVHYEGRLSVQSHPTKEMEFEYRPSENIFCWLPGTNLSKCYKLRSDMSWIVTKNGFYFKYKLVEMTDNKATIDRYIYNDYHNGTIVATEYYVIKNDK